ncbi:Uncharacterised protein [Mycobacteroides abscessus subsp. abscessus]|uniref:hypothetical protein n=1 Tax=Mycobacteroides abscessus TaxID=36809 RepID=UPI00092CA995|nr:hypothetical protein [Mycobacteroides abscessus]SHT83478.1 Uncharacterised protein [Mycobacteroides abscessus subsp. abscessus]SKO52429.1 Uncharacterised protein [Mycobacteroides abscessus subsp. abscessus]
MSDKTSRFTNIGDIRRANKKAGLSWFSPATIMAFGARVESRVYDEGISENYPEGSRVWVEFRKSHDSTSPEHLIARFNVQTGDISYAHIDYKTLVFDSARKAEKHITENMLGGAHGSE